MEKIVGRAVSGGIASGKIRVLAKKQRQINQNRIGDAAAEIARYECAKEKVIRRLRELHACSVPEVGEEKALIFEVQAMLLEDEAYNQLVHHIIENESANAEFAVEMAGRHFSAMFEKMEDEYLRERAADIRDVSGQVMEALNAPEYMDVSNLNAPAKQAQTATDTVGSDYGENKYILATEELTPAEILQLDKREVVAFVTREGSANSHTAILARAKGIPVFAGVEISPDWNEKEAVLDCNNGFLYIEPDEEILEKCREDADRENLPKGEEKNGTFAEELKGIVAESGGTLSVYANISSVEEVTKELAAEADGIGLVRTEFLFMGRDTCPTENEQFAQYKEILQKMMGKPVIFRTLDLGSDKQVPYIQLENEGNPALGCRGIRLCLEREDLFRVQLRALYRASAYGDAKIMFPMITSVEEVRRIKEICEEVKAELDAGTVELGVMIETPAAVMISDLLAKEVDFFSIGTNDLTQYTLAVDRQNPRAGFLFDAHHPAVLRMIQMVVENGRKENCRVGICGELAADTALTETFIKMGIDELSVTARKKYE